MKRFLLGFLLSVGFGIGLLALSDRFLTDTSEDTYLTGLRESSEAGCTSFEGRDSDLFVVGDSHSFTAWDFNALYESLGKPIISSCTLGGFYIETFAMLIQKLSSGNRLPKTIVYGASLRQFLTSPTKPQQLAEHGRILTQPNQKRRISLKNGQTELIAHLRSRPETPYQKQSRLLANLRNKLTDQMEEPATALIENTPDNPARKEWDKTVKETFVDSSFAAEQVSAICSWIQKNSVILVVVTIPESPFLERLYSVEQKTNYHEVLKRFEACAIKVTIGEAAFFGLGNRHFLNRRLHPAYPYDLVRDHKFDFLSKGTSFSVDILYDLDHMNLLGASVFTEAMKKDLQDVARSP